MCPSSSQRRAPGASSGFGPIGGGAGLSDDTRLNVLTGLCPNPECAGVPLASVLNTPEPAAGWLHGRALGVGRFGLAGPRSVPAGSRGAAGDTSAGLSGSGTPPVVDVPGPVATPEPIAFLLIGSGLVVFGMLARRRGSAGGLS